MLRTILQWIFIASALECTLALAQQERITAHTFDDESRNAVVRSLAPAAFKAFEDAAAKTNCVGIAQAAVELLRRVRPQIESQVASEVETNQWRSLRIWSGAWQLALRVWRVCDVPEARKVISDEWDTNLGNDDQFVGYQIAPLAAEWDRGLLTEGFWDLLRRTTNSTTLQGICFVLYQHGDLTDEKPLIAKRDSDIPGKLQEIIQTTVNWMTYRYGPKRTPEGKFDPGPAALGPTGPYRWYPYQ